MSGKPISAPEGARPVRIRLGPHGLLGDRALAPVRAGPHQLVLVRDGGRIVAAERACPHEGADLALGRCAAGRLHCPRHLASFDLRSGAVSPGWSFRALRLFPVETAADGLWITVAADGPEP
ncbi:MAG: Rieske (2Fe-2S) protein [Methylobacterium sp.]|uniref:Rieske (2Fe-2S) protein n=1 Tax=Methylobacterium sp. TaxID=409 RepID=UPI00258D9FC6|nr:Rieske (2Fe-2S) protein [Methylobacterium sp.]MBY0296126.1 Rieske (2Fe-2S) protein [Methylobacterium sp.]